MTLLAVSSPKVRQAKLLALTRWNGALGRTSDEVATDYAVMKHDHMTCFMCVGLAVTRVVLA